MRHGRGTMTWHAQSEMYSGDWRNGIQHGHGEHTWFAKRFVATTFVQHNQYVGEFADGKRHGVGTFYYASGATYVGEWVSDKKHGEAVYTSETGVVFAGTVSPILHKPDSCALFLTQHPTVCQRQEGHPNRECVLLVISSCSSSREICI